MPLILQPGDIKESRKGEGWRVIELANEDTFGERAMIARQWLFEPGAHGPDTLHGNSDQLLYVIRGSGTAIVNEDSFPLSEESILWLEPGEHYQFVAGDSGLEILQGYAIEQQGR